VATLGSIVALSCSLVVAGLHRRFAAVTAALSGVATMLLPKFRDWPPFLSYVITLAIGLRIAWPCREVSPARQQG
jgi:4-hydroxybenzoate polyprenyltransferase